MTKKELKRKRAYQKMYRRLVALAIPIIFAVLLFFIMIGQMKAYDNKKEHKENDMQQVNENDSITAEESISTEHTEENMKISNDNGMKTCYVDNVNVLILVNKENKLPTDYNVALHELQNGGSVAEVMYEDLKAMWNDGEEKNPGFSYQVCSAYRSAEKQQRLVEEEKEGYLNKGMSETEAAEAALLLVAPSGYSEHETGLAVDIVSDSNWVLDDEQEKTPENQWLQEHCYEYGFILRYPRGKEDITGYSYEPWHFRYVGRAAAKEIHDSGICLEEYLAR